MKPLSVALGAAAIVMLTGVVVCAEQPSAERPKLKPPEDFAQIADQKERSLALFNEAAKVITHPRCVNCHPAGDRPLQGEDGHPHLPLVVRGPAWALARSRCDARTATGPRITIRHACRDIRCGIWRRSRWRGRAKPQARSASRSRIRNETAAKRSKNSYITWRRIRSSGGDGIPVLVESPLQARRRRLAPSWKHGWRAARLAPSHEIREQRRMNLLDVASRSP